MYILWVRIETNDSNRKGGNSMDVVKTAKIKKWGNRKGIVLPKVILDMLSLKTDDSVNIEVIEQKIVITPNKRRRVTLAERFEGYEENTKQAEYWTDASLGKEFF